MKSKHTNPCKMRFGQLRVQSSARLSKSIFDCKLRKTCKIFCSLKFNKQGKNIEDVTIN